MDTQLGSGATQRLHGAPPDGFLIDGHLKIFPLMRAFLRGAPPDGFLIDGHSTAAASQANRQSAHRLTGFSSMDTREISRERLARLPAHRLTGFSSMDTSSW